MEHATTHGPDRMRHVVGDTGDLLASPVSVGAAVITAGLLHPLPAPVVLLAALPQGWASISSARLMLESSVRMSSRRRRLGVTSGHITGRDGAAEVRAFTTQDVLLGEHRRISDEITRDAVRLGSDRTLVQLVGRSLSGVGTAVAYLVLALLIYFGILELALTGAAALAMRTASQSVSNMLYQANHLYEATYFVDLFRVAVADAAGRRRVQPVTELRGDPEVITLTRGVVPFIPARTRTHCRTSTSRCARGEVIALVGENGSGKSTLAKLMAGLHLPTAGSVTWDGIETAAVDTRALHDGWRSCSRNPCGGR